MATVWEMLAECVRQLDEPFRRSEIVGWFRRHYPEVKESTLAAHIQGATANATNRERSLPGLGRRAPLLRRIEHGLYVRAATGEAGAVRSDGGVPPGSRRSPVGTRRSVHGTDRTRENVDALVADFADCVRTFETSGTFSGPSVYFHDRAIARRRTHSSARSLLADEGFLEYVYAVLTAWGMHRMGPQAAKMCEFGEFAASLRAAAPQIDDLWPLRIGQLPAGGAADIGWRVWQVIEGLRVSTSRTQLVAGSKTLQHVLPDLVPPVDRRYTFRFFTGQLAVRSDESAFIEWFPLFEEIAERCADPIDAALRRRGVFATGPAKVIDNAIIGYMHRVGIQSESDAAVDPL